MVNIFWIKLNLCGPRALKIWCQVNLEAPPAPRQAHNWYIRHMKGPQALV